MLLRSVVVVQGGQDDELVFANATLLAATSAPFSSAILASSARGLHLSCSNSRNSSWRLSGSQGDLKRGDPRALACLSEGEVPSAFGVDTA